MTDARTYPRDLIREAGEQFPNPVANPVAIHSLNNPFEGLKVSGAKNPPGITIRDTQTLAPILEVWFQGQDVKTLEARGKFVADLINFAREGAAIPQYLLTDQPYAAVAILESYKFLQGFTRKHNDIFAEEVQAELESIVNQLHVLFGLIQATEDGATAPAPAASSVPQERFNRLLAAHDLG